MDELSCATCGTLDDRTTIRTGFGESFPEAVARLDRLGLSSDHDIYHCLACGALFHWEDRPQFYGSGNLDEEILARLHGEGAECIRSLLSLTESSVECARLLERAFEAAPEDLVNSIAWRISFRNPAAFERMLLVLVDRVVCADDSRAMDTLLTYCYQRTDRKTGLRDLLAADPRPKGRLASILLDRCSH